MIPTPAFVLAGALTAVLGGAAGGWMARGVIAERDLAEIQSLHAQEKQRAADAARLAEVAARELEQKRVEKLAEIEHDAAKRTAAVQMDAARARAAADSLRAHVARLAAAANSRPAGDSTPSAGGQAAAGPGFLLADLFGRADDRAADLAAWADAAHTAGLACERAYQALRTP